MDPSNSVKLTNKVKISEWIEGIVQDIVSEDLKLEDTLRKVKILAFQIKNDKLKDWVNKELIGYKNNDLIPEYRKVPSDVKGDLIQQNFTSIVERKNQRLPIELLESKWFISLRSFSMFQNVAELELMVSKSKFGSLAVNLPIQVVNLIQPIIKNFHIDSAWIEISTNSVVGILSNLKTNLLTFLLELNEEIGSNKNLTFMNKKSKVDEIFNKTIGNISAENINISFGDKSYQSVSTGNTKTTIKKKTIKQIYKDTELVKDLKDLLFLFRKMEKEFEQPMEKVVEINAELSRIEDQAKTKKPERQIIKQSLEIIKTMILNIASNASTESVVIKIGEILSYFRS